MVNSFFSKSVCCHRERKSNGEKWRETEREGYRQRDGKKVIKVAEKERNSNFIVKVGKKERLQGIRDGDRGRQRKKIRCYCHNK